MSRPSRHHHAPSDPLEAAKIQAPPAPPAQAAAPVPASAPAPGPEALPPAPPAPAPVPADPAPAPARRWRVKTATHVSINGQIIRLNAGDVVSEEGYGPSGIARILSSNVPLEELP